MAAFLLAYLVYAIWAFVELQKIANSATLLDRVEALDTCSYNPPFLITAQIDNPSKLGLEIHWFVPVARVDPS